ncbi:MAG: EthD family reductase [Alphaproteobacteria bacterium]|nr:EthD family reductase [Alphaproteobacteria bacterium]
MIKVSVLYPHDHGATFDMGYYLDKHIPMVKQKLGAACKGVSVDRGRAGGAPGAPPAFVAMAHLLFESAEAFQAAFAPHAKQIMADIPNYTSIKPVIQVSDVKL